jgi:hypothetical protein
MINVLLIPIGQEREIHEILFSPDNISEQCTLLLFANYWQIII